MCPHTRPINRLREGLQRPTERREGNIRKEIEAVGEGW